MSLNAKPRAIAKNAASGYVTLLLGATLGFLITPILLSELGTTGFGLWSLMLASIAYLALLEAGLSFATLTRVAMTEAEGAEATSRLLSTSLVLSICVGVAGLLVAVGLSAVFPLVFDVPAGLAGEVRVAIVLLGATQALTFVSMVFTASLLGTGRMYYVNLGGFTISALASVAQAAALLAGSGITTLAAIQLASAIAVVALFRRKVRRALPGVSVTLAGFHRPTAKLLLAMGWRNSAYGVASTLAYGSDVVLVGLLLDPRAAAAYAIAVRGYTLMQRIATGVLSALGPAHAHAAQHSTVERRFRLYCVGTYATLSLATFGALTAGIFAPQLLDIWLGDVPAGAPAILTVLCAVLVLHAPGVNAATLLLSSEMATALTRITVTAAVVNIVASIVFTLMLGRLGPALGSLVAAAIFDAVYLPLRICRLLDRPYADFVRQALMPLLLPVLLLCAILTAGRLLDASGVLVLLVATAGAGAFFGWLWHQPTSRGIRVLLRDRDLAAA